jgi:ATP-dependent Clp endopeptidase proteolytic subunit ClpP
MSIPNSTELNCQKSDFTISIREETNDIYFNGKINNKSMPALIKELTNMEQKINKKIKKIKKKVADIEKSDEDNDFCEIKVTTQPIKLHITTYGGTVYDVFTAIDTIKNMKVDVNTICKGIVASAGTLLSLAGKKRYITENSYMLIHEVRSGSWGKYSDIKEEYENVTELMEHLKKYYVKNTKITEEELVEQLRKDTMWNAQKCLEKGLVDEIL